MTTREEIYARMQIDHDDGYRIGVSGNHLNMSYDADNFKQIVAAFHRINRALSAEPDIYGTCLGDVPGVGISAPWRKHMSGVLPIGDGWDDLPDATPEEIKAWHERQRGVA